jgi:tRNA threonylcarbamoyladenosine biosynthesis protein TsaE
MLLRATDLSQTHAVSAAVASLARPGDMIVLSGEMGAGKTAFAQGFGRALGVTEPITSPTFTLVHSYPIGSKLTMHHADLYRLDRTVDVDELALHELAGFGGIVLVEWGDVAAAGLGDHLEVRMVHPAMAGDDEGGDDEGGDADAAASHDPDRLAHDDEFADDGVREIEITQAGPAWSGRWERLTRAVEAFRC